MKRTWAITLVAMLTSLAAGRLTGDEVLKDRIEASRAVARGFADRLRTELQQTINASGPTGAIQACSSIAPAIAVEMLQATGWRVARATLKTRNPLNAPDPWEARVLATFGERKAARPPARIQQRSSIRRGRPTVANSGSAT